MFFQIDGYYPIESGQLTKGDQGFGGHVVRVGDGRSQPVNWSSSRRLGQAFLPLTQTAWVVHYRLDGKTQVPAGEIFKNTGFQTLIPLRTISNHSTVSYDLSHNAVT